VTQAMVIRQTVQRFAPAAILAAAWGLLIGFAWPGFMTWDSVNQLSQARSGNYGNWHPPIMAWLWSVLDARLAGPGLMLILQTGLFMIGLYAVIRRYAPRMQASAIAAVVLLFPPVFGPLLAIWKDSLMAALLLCGVAGLTSAARAPRLLAWLALVVVAALRHNAPILVVPLTILLVPYAPRWPSWRRRALGAGLGLGVSLAGMLVSRALTRVDEHPFANMIAMPDLASVIASADPMSDAEVRTLVEDVHLVVATDIQAHLRSLDATQADYTSLGLGDQRVFDLVTTDAQSSAMVRAWRRAMLEHPGTYLAHRERRLLDVLGFTRTRPLPYILPRGESANLLAMVGEVRSYSRFQLTIGRWLGKINRTIVFWPTLYAVLGIGLLVILWRDPLQRGLLIGALGYELALVFLSPGGQEYRYSHWMVTCVVIATVVRFLGVARTRPGPAPVGWMSADETKETAPLSC